MRIINAPWAIGKAGADGAEQSRLNFLLSGQTGMAGKSTVIPAKAGMTGYGASAL